MRILRSLSRRAGLVLVALVGALLTACPPDMPATRDGGTPCSNLTACNPAGRVCGEVNLCVEGYCTDMTAVVACRDGGLPDGQQGGNCFTYADCNPPPACGLVISCINSFCDPTAQRIMIDCPDVAAIDAADSADSQADASGVDAQDAMNSDVRPFD